MRKRDRLGCWQQLLTLLGTSLLSRTEWIKLYRNFLRSWKRLYYLKLYENRDVSAPPPAAGASSPGRHRYTIAPPSGSGSSGSPVKHRSSLGMPSSPSVHRIKRRNSLVSPSSLSNPPTKRRSSLLSPSVPPIHPTKSLYPKGQICDSLLKSAKRKNSVAAPDFDINDHTLLSPIKRRDSEIPEVKINDSPPIKRRDSMALEKWLKPFQLISPLATSPISLRDSLSPNLGMDHKESVCPLSPTRIKRRDSSVTAPPRVKSRSSLPEQPQQKPISIVKHVTGSGDELDDETSLSTWKEYCAQLKAKNTKPSVSPANGFPPQKCPKQQVVEPPVKRKRGRPSREEKAKRLEEEQAQKMRQALKESSMKKSTSDQDLDQKKSCRKAAPQLLDARKQKPHKTDSQSNTTSLSSEPSHKSHKPSKPHKQKPTAKPRCQSTCSFSDREGSDIAKHANDLVQPAILDEDAIPPAHMPEDALDLKSPSKAPPGDKAGERAADTEGEVKAEEEEEVRPTANGYNNHRKKGRSRYNRIICSLSSDEEEDAQLLLQRAGLVANDLETEERLLDAAINLISAEDDRDAENRLLDNAMDLTSPVGGGGDGDKDAQLMDIDLDLLVSDDNVANQIALIDSQLEISLPQCQQEAKEMYDQCLETSTNDQQLPHTSEFFDKLPSLPPVDVNADKSNLLWPFQDEEEVLDYEVDYDVLTLVVSSDELEEECVSKSKEESQKTESKSRNQNNTPNDKEKSTQPELPPKPADKPNVIPNANSLKDFRIPRLNPELLRAQPTVMHSLYLQEEAGVQNMEKVNPGNPALSEEVRKRREEAMAARRPKETTPQFAPPYRQTREESAPEDLSQPQFGPQDLAPPPPMFGPEDLAPIVVPPSNREESSDPHTPEASPCAPEFVNMNSLPEKQPQQQQPSGTSQYLPENLATGQRNTCPAEVPPPPRYEGLGARHWMTQVFGAKCLRFLDNKCLAPNCDHTMSSMGEVERRLLSMPEETLIHTYRQALRSFYIFAKFFKCFANIFERRKLHKHLLQLMANGRLYRNLTVAIIRHVFPALKRSGLEREATGCLMTDLWMPDKSHKFGDVTSTILEILETTNWQDYIDQLRELHETYKFFLSDKFMIRIMKWADVTKNMALQKNAMFMLYADMATYVKSPTLMSLVNSFSSPDPNSNLSRSSTAQQQQYPASNLNNTETNQIPSLIPHQDRLPGAGSNPSLIGKPPASRQPPQYPANWNCNSQTNSNPNFAPQLERLSGAGPGPSPLMSNLVHKPPHCNHNPNPNPTPFRALPGASSGPSLIWSTPLVGQHQGQHQGQQQQQQQQQHQQQHQHQQQQHSAATWRSQADKVNRANDNTSRSFPAGFQ